MGSNLVVGFIILLVLVIAGAVSLFIIAKRNPHGRNENVMQQRLEEFVESGENVTLEEIEMSQPFRDRVLIPIASRLGEFTLRFTPQNVFEGTKLKIEHAGLASTIDPTVFLAAKFILAAFLGGLFIFIFAIGTMSMSAFLKFLLIIIGILLGFFVPDLLLQSKINTRQKNIVRALPDALDLLTICVEAGLGFDSAMAKVSEKWETELSLEFARVNREIQLGKTRREALRNMSDRLGVSELSSFIAAIIQTEQLGVSLAKVLRIQSDQMRIRRKQLAEQEAHKAPLKMLFPMALLILPALIIVLLTPAVFQVMNSALGSMF
ncbi:MAG: type II secretion system F family protein [Anaerolineaceae bacterium]|nr:type II secretion system F family protein [Anaerolineaceae bacterium]